MSNIITVAGIAIGAPRRRAIVCRFGVLCRCGVPSRHTTCRRGLDLTLGLLG
jgi:hypothetical protein